MHGFYTKGNGMTWKNCMLNFLILKVLLEMQQFCLYWEGCEMPVLLLKANQPVISLNKTTTKLLF